MANDVTLDDLLKKQSAMNELAAQMFGESDVERIQALGERLKAEGEELSRMARAVEEKFSAGPMQRGNTEVVLTADQRKRVLAATGVDVPSLLMRDDAGIATRTMPTTDPRIIEFYAMAEGRRRKAASEADVIVRAQLDDALHQIESQGTEPLREQLAQLKEDPAFFGGLLQKK